MELVSEPFIDDDDGYSGVTFDRPQFKLLEEELRRGRIDCIVVKDLSRFLRNYIDGGRYIEKIFPQLGIRFIAVNDAYDSLTGNPQSDSFIIPFKNLINDSYCKDISMKIRSSLEVKRKSGEFVGAFAPYGYEKSSDNRSRLVIDELAAETVKMIFSLYMDGVSIEKIADRLNKMGVLSPMEYRRSKGEKFETAFKRGDVAKWTYKAVKRILTNDVYIGVLAQGKRGTPNHKVKTLRAKDESEWTKVENAHEATISYDDFTAVGEMLKRDTRCSADKSEVAISARLSVENSGKPEEKDVIQNQIEICKEYVKSCPYLNLVEVYADNGHTGTVFDRPEFNWLMSDIRSGRIKCLVVRDLSRFGRDYIETGTYLECVFPFLGVRFISVNDGYDSDDYKGTTSGLEVVMRNIIYAAYSKDLSVKTTTAKVQLMKQGKYVGGYAPYGYMMHPTVRKKLAIDPDSARIVRRIFDEAMAGKNASEIAKELNDDKIPTPGQHFRSNHPGKKNFSYMSGKISWNPPMIYRILTKPVYTGATVGHAIKNAAPLSKKRVRADKSDWIIVENMHEPIVTKAEFNTAQKAIRKEGKKAPRKISDYPLQGLVRCGNCRQAMRRRVWNGKAYFTCMNSMQDSDTECAVGEHYAEDEIERVAFNAIKQVIQLAEQEHIQIKQTAEKRKSN